MGEGTNIAWAHDTWNTWIGCSKVSTCCKFCYADDLDEQRFSKTLGGATAENPIRHWGPGAPRQRTSKATFEAPLRWNKKPFVCSRCGALPLGLVFGEECGCGGYVERRRVFCGSLMDWADEEVPDQWRNDLFDIADACEDLTFMFLTKRIGAARAYLGGRYPKGLPDNFWIGMSWQPERPWDADILRSIPARVRFLSVEPMVEPFPDGYLRGIQWVIFGGESGRNARPCNIEWIRDGVRMCRLAGVKPFVKQLGARPQCVSISYGCSKLLDLDLKDPKGADPAEWPYLRVRELP